MKNHHSNDKRGSISYNCAFIINLTFLSLSYFSLLLSNQTWLFPFQFLTSYCHLPVFVPDSAVQ